MGQHRRHEDCNRTLRENILALYAARFLATYQKIKPKDSSEDYRMVTLAAVAAFGNLGRDAAVEFAEKHWQRIDQVAMELSMYKDLDDLDTT